MTAKRSFVPHVHDWKEHAPGTWGADVVRTCTCGLYDILRPSAPGLSVEEQVNAARAMRLWEQQGYVLSDTEPTTANGGTIT